MHRIIGRFRLACQLLRHGRELRDGEKERARWRARPPEARVNLVLCLMPPFRFIITGGVISLLNIAAESRRILGEDWRVALCYPPGRSGLARNVFFPNEECILSFADITRRYPCPERLVAHIPEYMAGDLAGNEPFHSWLRQAGHAHVNIANQNILFMPAAERLEPYRRSCAELTQTTAHWSYSTREVCERWGMALHFLSAVLGKDYPWLPHGQKKNLIAYSPDRTEGKSRCLRILRQALPGFQFKKIAGLLYIDYLVLISTAKYVISFGEGLDGFFTEPFHCGSVGAAVRNEVFFPKNFKTLATLYADFDDLAERLPADIASFEADPQSYAAYSRETGELWPSAPAWEAFRHNLRLFYSGRYTLSPGKR